MLVTLRSKRVRVPIKMRLIGTAICLINVQLFHLIGSFYPCNSYNLLVTLT